MMMMMMIIIEEARSLSGESFPYLTLCDVASFYVNLFPNRHPN